MRIVVFGLGSMGKRRIRLLKELRSDIEIKGIDIQESRIKDVSDMFGIKCSSKIDTQELEDSDCVFVCTSPLSHGKIIQRALECDCHVFTEINLDTNLYEKNIKLAVERGKTLFLSSTPIYKDEIKEIQKDIKDTNLPVKYIYHVGQYLPEWHPWEKISDFFVSDKRTNGCRELLAIELPWITRTMGTIKDCRVISSNISNLKLGYADSYQILLEHEGKNQGMLAIDVVTREPVRKLEIYNENIHIEWDGTPDTLIKRNVSSGKMEKAETGKYKQESGYVKFINEYAYKEEIEEFFKKVKGESCVIHTFEADKKILEWIDRIEEGN